MDGRKDTLNDAALEQEIEALLSVEPSPDFVARVRSRVAEEPTSSGWGWRWPIVAVVTAMALTAVGVALWRPAERPAPSANAPATHAAADVAAPVVVLPRDKPVVGRVPRQRTRVIAAPRRTIEIALPPVIIAENEVRAFAALMADRRTARFNLSTAVARTAEDPVEIDKMPKLDPVTLDPIEIKPLVKVVELE